MSPEIQNLINQQERQWRTDPNSPGYIEPIYQGYENVGVGGDDDYSNYLIGLINANSQDPKFQDQILGYYLDYMDPRNKKAPIIDENKINTAQSLMSSDDPLDKEWGRALIAEVYGKPASLSTSGYGLPQSYADVIRSKAKEEIADPSGLDADTFEWNNYLANKASDEQLMKYEMSKPTIKDVFQQEDEDVSPWKNILSGAGLGAAYGAGLGSVFPVVGTGVGALGGGTAGLIDGLIKTLLQISKEKKEMKREAAGYSGYSY